MKTLLFTVVVLLAAPTAFAQNSVCPANFAPVCGVLEVQCITVPCPPIQQTYSNDCARQVAGAALLHEGSCSADTTCPVVVAPNCGDALPVVDHDANGCESFSCPAPPAPDTNGCRLWFDGCNVCQRNTIGGALACGDKQCEAPQAARCVTPFAATTTAPADCQRWFDGCNTCFRDTDSGALTCTEMACAEQGAPACLDTIDTPAATPVTSPVATPPAQCQRWFDGCNTCVRRSASDQFRCTQLACQQQNPSVCEKYFPKVAPVVAVPTTPEPVASDETEQVGFFTRLWRAIIGFFQALGL